MMALLLSACSSSYSSAPDKIAATVNGEQIAVHRIDPPSGEATGQAALAALEQLIDQVLLARKASALRLDHDAAVLGEIEQAKQKILAKTYVDRSIPAQSVRPDEILAFYRAHPAWFELRQSFRLNELVVSIGPEQMGQFRTKAAGSSRLDELAEWLHSRKLPFLLIPSIKFSEQLPSELLPRIAALKNGQRTVLEVPGNPGSLAVVELLQAQAAPLNLDEASPLIAKHLLAQARLKFAQTKARQLRAAASIEYLGPFAEARRGALPAPVAPLLSGKNDNYFPQGLSGLF